MHIIIYIMLSNVSLKISNNMINGKFFIISLFDDFLDENSRASAISRRIVNNQLITSNFDHSQKIFKEEIAQYNTICLKVPSYKRNLGIGRIYSHLVFAFRLNKFLSECKDPIRAVYCFMPTSTAAFICGIFCKRKKVKFIIDIIDIWPDSLLPVSKWFVIAYPFLCSWKLVTVLAYKMADYIVAESKQYAQIAHRFNLSVPYQHFYLGVDKALVHRLITSSNLKLDKPVDQIWVCYGGSLGTSYDFDEILQVLNETQKIYNYKFFFIGDGVERNHIEDMVSLYNLDVFITGFLSYQDYLCYLYHCDIAINIFRKNTKVVHSYKFNDYVATNCFILNSLDGETSELIEKYKIGKNFDFDDNSLKNVLVDILDNWSFYEKYRNNNQILLNEILDKNKIYSSLPSFIDEIEC